MILGIGTDITEVARIQSSLDKFGDSFLQRILLPGEITYCRGYQNPAPQIAARFAAKEAISKAFGTGIGAELGWHDLEICRKESGEPFVVLHGGGRKLFTARKAQQLLITLSHTHNYATAVAVLEG
ncbi:MAG: holo-ACP synthase [Verrucomicrobiota bacterium]